MVLHMAIKSVLDGNHIYEWFSSLILICIFNVKGLISKLLHNLLSMVDSSLLPQNKDCENGVFFFVTCVKMIYASKRMQLLKF
jgi:hypothetical protein